MTRMRCLTPMFLVLAAACAGPARAPTAGDLRVELWKSADEVFNESHAVLDADARRTLRDFVEQGADRLAEDHASADEVRAASDRVRVLTVDIVSRANRGALGDKGVIEVLEKDVKAIRDKVCPLYPFCK